MTSLSLNTEHKTKYSNYLITVNSNQAALDDDRREELVESLRQVLVDIFKHDTVTDLVDFLIVGDSFFTNVDDTEIHFSIEQGKKQKRIHAHAIVRIRHDSTIHWNYSKFRQMIIEGLRFELMDEAINPHIDIKAFGGRNPSKDAEDYILKDLKDGNTELIHEETIRE